MTPNDSGAQDGSTGDDSGLVHKVIERPDPPAESAATEWETYFPFDEPYPAQQRAIEESRETLENGGFVTAELACGTGKTLYSLTRGLSMVRDPETDYERVLALTSVKQQLRAFEDDLKTINSNLDDEIDPVSALTLVGKADMCSLSDAGEIDDERIYSRCEELREPVKTVISNTPADEVPGRLANLAEKGRIGATDDQDALATDEWTSPYGTERPTLGDGGEGNPSICSFYAEYRRETWGDEGGCYSPKGVMTPEEVRADASAKGLCPHAVMSDAITNAEVVVANYYHAFDPLTRQALTGSIIDEKTLIVCDEAHMLVPRVRELLGDSISRWSLEQARNEILSQITEQSNNGIARTMKRVIREHGVSEDDLEEFVEFLAEAKDKLSQMALDALDDENSQWHNQRHGELPSEIEEPLRDPLTPQPDDFSQWAADAGYGDQLGNAGLIGNAVADAIQEASEEHQNYTRHETHTDGVGRVLRRWAECDHKQYFREVSVERRASRNESKDLAWAEHYSASLAMKNCLPAEEVAEQFDRFGGGILMSATLAPLDIYRRTIGLDQLAEEGRPIKEIVAGLPFPEENRESCAVDLSKFTYGNRGPSNPRYRDDEQNDLREQYGSMIREVARSTDGNVLVAMPSYAEGEWAADVVRKDSSIDKPVLVDESSSNDETEALKDEFFAGDGKVLTTSLRGTLTEGVDYAGDRLAACISCGVPIRSTNGPVPKAIKTAYEREFGKKNGFDYAFTVPAVRKSRQALGRVIRGSDETGVRVLADRRWATSHNWDDVRNFMPGYEREDYSPTEPDELAERLDQFWTEA